MSLKPAIRLGVDVSDIQAIVWSGFDSLKGARYVMLRVSDATAARQWLRGLEPTSFGGLYGKDGVTVPHDKVVQVAFTASGLYALGVDEDVMTTFAPEFEDGMTGSPNRSLRLGDIGANAPDKWEWGYCEKEPHVLLILFAVTDAAAGALAADHKADAEKHGLTVIGEPLSCSDLGDKEQFGFTDGISQPSFDWEVPRKPGTVADRDYTNLVALGELLLGYHNEYGLLTERPTVPASEKAGHLRQEVHPPGHHDLGRNGTYLVFRQLEQDVYGFRRWVDAEAGRLNVTPDELAEIMVGRKRNGDPLDDLTVGRSIPGTGASDAQRNGFLYDTDPDGLSCPLGSHIRRANPRTGDAPGGRRSPIDNLLVTLGLTRRRRPAKPTSSTLPWPLNSTIWPFVRLQDDAVASARFHRILRRGREYGPQARDGEQPVDQDKRGLHFLCLNANIARQFEFVQGAWMASAKFAALSGEQDPLLGNREPFPAPPVGDVRTDGFSRPGAPPNCKYSSGLPQFVTVRGGAYFFLPGLAALKWIASD